MPWVIASANTMELIAHMRIKKGSLLSEPNKRFAVCTGGDGGKMHKKWTKKFGVTFLAAAANKNIFGRI